MKKIRYSNKVKRQMSGHDPRARHHLSEDQKMDIRDFCVWMAAALAFMAACALYIGLL